MERDRGVEAEYFLSSLNVVRQRESLGKTDFFREHEERLQNAQDLFDRYGITLEEIMIMTPEEYHLFATETIMRDVWNGEV